MTFEMDRGADWRIWDLHVHTPASVVQNYGADTEETWERFISDLESLPDEVCAIGISDYWFLDGYRKVLEYRSKGRLANIDVVFPLIEMRLNLFGGANNRLTRANLHVLFDPAIDSRQIEAQFVSSLPPSMVLTPDRRCLWDGLITRESMEELGRKIKESVPENQLRNYDSDIVEGFNNLTVSLDQVMEALNSHYFLGKTLLGLGKAEWASISWADGSIATKKNLINRADFLFSAMHEQSSWKENVRSLQSSNVNHKLLDCSDAHHFSDSRETERVGQCQTWINTIPTFSGLKYALSEFDRRVFVGSEPPASGRIRRSPERVISRIKVTSTEAGGNLFNHNLPLNSGFVAIVGNKGQGKSALLDCIAHAGNSSRNKEFAFLTTDRFLNARSRKTAAKYASTIEWKSGHSRTVMLSAEHDLTSPVSVEYLPQRFVERVCNIDPTTEDAKEFEFELRSILFSHIAEAERLGSSTFDELLDQKTKLSKEEIEQLRAALNDTIAEYEQLTRFIWGNNLSDVEAKLRQKEEEVASAEADLTKEQAALALSVPPDGEDQRTADLTKQLDEQNRTIEGHALRLAAKQSELADLRRVQLEMQDHWKRAKDIKNSAEALNQSVLRLLGDEGLDLLSVEIHEVKFTEWDSRALAKIEVCGNESTNLEALLKKAIEEKESIENALSAVDRERAVLRQRVDQTIRRKNDLIGSDEDPRSLRGLERLKEKVLAAPNQRSALRMQMLRECEHIYGALKRQLDAVRGLYQPASRYIENLDVVADAGLEFNAELTMLSSRWGELSRVIDGRRSAPFIEWLSDFPSHFSDRDWTELAHSLSEALSRLETKGGEVEGERRDPATALNSGANLSDFLTDLLGLSWLEVRFSLLGDGQPLTQLSPGQRGLILALFYLVVDQNTVPLLLDQPEENLDNATIASRLVPAIHEAAGRRQTIVVTHNANLAIVGDADQIIHCEYSGGEFTVQSGCIAEVNTAKYSVDVLEGTKRAFDNRQVKYEVVV